MPEISSNSPSASPKAPTRILIVRLSAIGDCVMASPVAQALRESFPNAHIAWAVGEKSVGVVQGNPHLDEVLVWKSGWKGFWEIVGEIRKRKFDTVLELQGRPKSSLLMALSGAKRRLVSPRFGFISQLFSTEKIEHPPGLIYPPLRYICWARALGAKVAEPELSVPVSELDRSAAKELLGDDAASWVAFNPGCSATNRKWGVEKFAETAEILVASHPGVKIVVCGGPQDVDDAAIIANRLPKERTVVAAGKLKLRETTALFERCDAMVTNDTGPMHMAVASGASVVGVFGPVEAKRRLPDNDRCIGIEHNHGCKPPNRPQCGKGTACSCLQSVTSAEVAGAVSRLLEKA